MPGIYDPRAGQVQPSPGPIQGPVQGPAPDPEYDIGDIKEFMDEAFDIHGYDPIPFVIQQFVNEASLDVAIGSRGISFRADVLLEPSAPATATRRISLGTHDLPNQSRGHKHSNFDYRYETRSAWMKAYVDVTHPSIDSIISDAVSCAQAAATAAVLAAIYAGNPGAGFAIFWPAFKACMYTKIGNRVNELGATLGSVNETGCWTYHC